MQVSLPEPEDADDCTNGTTIELVTHFALSFLSKTSVACRYQPEPEEADDWASDLAAAMLTYRPEHILSGELMFGDFDNGHLAGLVETMLADATPVGAGSCRVDLQTSQFQQVLPWLQATCPDTVGAPGACVP